MSSLHLPTLTWPLYADIVMSSNWMLRKKNPASTKADRPMSAYAIVSFVRGKLKILTSLLMVWI
jgi:hypothetical protein